MKRAALLLALASCAKAELDLVPFPCPKDFICPSEVLACIDGFCQRPAHCSYASQGLVSGCSSGEHPERSRCVAILVGDANADSVCVTPKGIGTTAAPCHVKLPPFGAAGAYLWLPTAADDECASDYQCYSPFLDPGAAAACRKLCASLQDCASNEICAPIGNAAQAPLTEGVCVPACDLFAANACPGGQTCTLAKMANVAAPANVLPAICAAPGPVQLGGACDDYLRDSNGGTQRCVAGLQCTGNPSGPGSSCEYICRTQSDCPSGTTCGGSQGCPPSSTVCACR